MELNIFTFNKMISMVVEITKTKQKDLKIRA